MLASHRLANIYALDILPLVLYRSASRCAARRPPLERLLRADLVGLATAHRLTSLIAWQRCVATFVLALAVPQRVSVLPRWSPCSPSSSARASSSNSAAGPPPSVHSERLPRRSPRPRSAGTWSTETSPGSCHRRSGRARTAARRPAAGGPFASRDLRLLPVFLGASYAWILHAPIASSAPLYGPRSRPGRWNLARLLPRFRSLQYSASRH